MSNKLKSKAKKKIPKRSTVKKKILPPDIKNQTNEIFKKSLNELDYPNE